MAAIVPITMPATFGALVLVLLLGASTFAAGGELLDMDDVRLRFPPTKPGKLAVPLDLLLLDCESDIVDVANVLGGIAKEVI